MTDEPRDAGLGVVLILAGVLGIVHLALGSIELLRGRPTTAATILSGARAFLGLLLLPTVVGLIVGAPWARYLGVVGLGGIAVVQLLPLLAGPPVAAPLAGIVLAGGGALYLLLAPEEFDSEDDTRPISEDTDPHRFMR